jgi:hypothetical protein
LTVNNKTRRKKDHNMANETAPVTAEPTKPEEKKKDNTPDFPLPPEFKGHKVTRNGIEVELEDCKIVKGDLRGQHYVAPKVTKETLAERIQWLGLDEAATALEVLFKRIFQKIWKSCRDNETGALNFQQFLQEAVDFTAAGMTISEIREKIDEAQETLRNHVSAATKTPALFADAAWQAKAKKLDEEIVGLQGQEEKRSRSGKKEETAEAAIHVS